MNDFTKEELEQIEYSLLYTGMDGETVLLKLQSMIDNYCEHEFKIIGSGKCLSQKCDKCGKIEKLLEFK